MAFCKEHTAWPRFMTLKLKLEKPEHENTHWFNLEYGMICSMVYFLRQGNFGLGDMHLFI